VYIIVRYVSDQPPNVNPTFKQRAIVKGATAAACPEIEVVTGQTTRKSEYTHRPKICGAEAVKGKSSKISVYCFYF